MNNIKKYIPMDLLFHFIKERNKNTITFIDFDNISFRILENFISCSYFMNNCLYSKSIFKFWKIFNQYFINLNPFRWSHFSLQSFFKVENITQLRGLCYPKAFSKPFAAIISYCIFCCIRKSTKK
jgi:hypothetical protein